VPVFVAVNTLVPDTTYHVRLVATNSFGTTYGDDQVIRTLPQPTSTISLEEEEEKHDPEPELSPLAIASATLQPMSQYLNTGTAPLAGLFKGSDGNFYGTLSTGGTLAPRARSIACRRRTLTTLANFTTHQRRAQRQQSAVESRAGADGNFYGTTNTGGNSSSYGTIFKMTPAGR